MIAKAIVVVIEGEDDDAVTAQATMIAQLFSGAMVINGFGAHEPSVIDWPTKAATR